MLAFTRFADILGSRLVAAFDAIPAGRYDYRPTPSQQTVGCIAQHLEDANYRWCHEPARPDPAFAERRGASGSPTSPRPRTRAASASTSSDRRS